MQILSQVGGSVTNSLAYVGALASLGGRARVLHFCRSLSGKAYSLPARRLAGARRWCTRIPILSLITFFIGLILALQAAYELRRFVLSVYVATAVAISMSRELGP